MASTKRNALPLFFEECLNPQVRINKRVKEHTVDYHPNLSELTSRMHPRMFLWTPKGFISPEYLLDFISNLCFSPWLRKGYGVNSVKITGKYICESKKKWNLFIFTNPSKTLPQIIQV